MANIKKSLPEISFDKTVLIKLIKENQKNFEKPRAIKIYRAIVKGITDDNFISNNDILEVISVMNKSTVNFVWEDSGLLPLLSWAAATPGRSQLLLPLLDAGADIYQKDLWNYPAIIPIVKNKHSVILEKILPKKNINFLVRHKISSKNNSALFEYIEDYETLKLAISVTPKIPNVVYESFLAKLFIMKSKRAETTRQESAERMISLLIEAYPNKVSQDFYNTFILKKFGKTNLDKKFIKKEKGLVEVQLERYYVSKDVSNEVKHPTSSTTLKI